jgi:hypothetical protein
LKQEFHAKREIIFNSGNLIRLKQPGDFNAVVKKFLNSHEFYKVLNSEAAVKYCHNEREIKPRIELFTKVR